MSNLRNRWVGWVVGCTIMSKLTGEFPLICKVHPNHLTNMLILTLGLNGGLGITNILKLGRDCKNCSLGWALQMTP